MATVTAPAVGVRPAPAPAGSVYKVIRLVASSPVSWEDAARRGVAEGAKTIRDLRVARLTQTDAVVRDGVLVYRVKLEMSFRLDRMRAVEGRAEPVLVHRCLIVANQTLTSPDLLDLARQRAAAGPCEFHVLVPLARPTLVMADPVMGMTSDLASDPAVVQAYDDEARERLESFLDQLSAVGLDVSGEIGPGDPVAAARQVMERSSFDEIIVSTLPGRVSRWLKLDLPSRLERAFSVPVTQLEHAG